MVDNYEDSMDPAEIMKDSWFHDIFPGYVRCKGIQECTQVFDAVVGIRHDGVRYQWLIFMKIQGIQRKS